MWVTVIIPAFNSQSTLRRATESIIRAGGSDVGVLIVDDGSTDATWGICQSLADEFSNVSVFQHAGGVNQGVSASRNLGLRMASSDMVAFLDADDCVLPNRFRSSQAILMADPTVDAVYQTARVVLEDDSQGTDWNADEIFGIDEELEGLELLKTLMMSTTWPISGIVFRRRLLESTGLFHPSLSIAEDCHLWMRMAVLGRIVPGDLSEPVSEYRRHEGSLYSPTPERRLDYWKALLDFYHWSRREDIKPAVREVIDRRVALWIQNALVQCRQNGWQSIARRLACSAAWHTPKLALTKTNLSNLVRT